MLRELLELTSWRHWDVGVSTVENLLLLDAHHICKLSGLEESEVRLVKEKAAEMWACPLNGFR